MSLQALIRGDNASRIAFYKGMFELGMTINQILALEDMNGIGADGDVPFVSNNVQTLERAILGPGQPHRWLDQTRRLLTPFLHPSRMEPSMALRSSTRPMMFNAIKRPSRQRLFDESKG
jgi:hypothetical protein